MSIMLPNQSLCLDQWWPNFLSLLLTQNKPFTLSSFNFFSFVTSAVPYKVYSISTKYILVYEINDVEDVGFFVLINWLIDFSFLAYQELPCPFDTSFNQAALPQT